MPDITIEYFSGTHYEIGIQQGQAVYGLIQQILQLIPHLDIVKQMKPRFLPTSLFLTLAKRRAKKLLTDDIFQYYPEQAQRMKGIAEGVEIDLSTLLFMQSMEFLIARPTEDNYRLEACTSLGFTPHRTTTGEPILAKNFDYVNELAPFHLTCQTSPKERYATLGSTMAPLPGMLEGMNEYGLSVTYNLGFTTDNPSNFAPLSMALQEMLETCKTTDEAVQFITHAKQGGHDALLMLADAEGTIKSVELTSNHSAIREPKNGRIINTNHYHTEEMQQYEIPHNATWVSGVPESRIGDKVHLSSEQRLRRAEELLENKEKVNETQIIAILRDHGKDNTPSNLTICRHDEYTSTLRSMIFYPSRKTLKVLYGNPCQNDFVEFAIQIPKQ